MTSSPRAQPEPPVEMCMEYQLPTTATMAATKWRGKLDSNFPILTSTSKVGIQ